jgi:hypothetical protein
VRILVLILGLLFTATAAFAKPKIAVAPFKGDKNNKVADAIAESLAEQAKVTEPKATGKAIKSLALGNELDNDEAKKLRKKLEVDAVVQGKLDKDGKNQTLKIAIFVKGKEPARFTVQFKTTSVKFRDDMRDVIMKKVEADDGKVASNDDDDKKNKKKKKDDDDDGDKKKNKDDDDDRKKKKKKKNDDDDDRKKATKKDVAEGGGTDDDGGTRVRKKKRQVDDDETPTGPRKLAARLDVGAFAGVRRLTYSSTMQGPRPVGTFTRAAHLEGELYPFAFGDQKSAAATGFGLAAEYEKTVGLAITIPGTTTAVPIDQSHYSIGVRYRIAANPTTAITIGADYARRQYIADRSKLGSPGELDAPDVDYKAIFPSLGIAKRFSTKAAFFARAGGLAILDTGDIQERDQYGAATVFGLDARAGFDVFVSERVALRFAGHFGQISFKFKGNGDLAEARGVEGATDREFGLASMLGVTY